LETGMSGHFREKRVLQQQRKKALWSDRMSAAQNRLSSNKSMREHGSSDAHICRVGRKLQRGGVRGMLMLVALPKPDGVRQCKLWTSTAAVVASARGGESCSWQLASLLAGW